MRVWIDDKQYAIEGDPEQFTAEPFIDAVAPTRFHPDNAASYITLRIPNLTRGLGRRRVASNKAFDESEYQRGWDFRGDTRFENGSYLPPQEKVSTGELESIHASTEWQNKVWTLWTGASAGTGASRIAVREISSFNFSGGGNLVDNAVENVGQDIIPFKDKLVAMYAGGTSHHVEHSTDGASWVAATSDITAGLLSDAVTENEGAVFGRLEVAGDECVAIVWHESQNTVTFFSSSSPEQWRTGTGKDEAVDIPCGSSIQGTAVYQGPDGVTKMLYVLVDSGLWEIDVSGATWTTSRIEDVPGGGNVLRARRMVVHDGSLWLTTSTSYDLPFDMYRITHGNNERLIEINKSVDGEVLLGLAGGDGVPTQLLGRILSMKSAGPFLYATLGGEASGRNATILCHNGLGWHYIHRNTTEAQIIPWLEVDNETLHFTKRTAANAHTGHFLKNIHANPTTGISVPRDTSGFAELPIYDAGFLETGGWMRVRINAEDMVGTDTSGEYFSVVYGIDSGTGSVQAHNTNTLANMTVGTTEKGFPSTVAGTDYGIGIESVNMALRVNFNRDTGDTLQSPVLKDILIDVLKQPADRDGWDLNIDIDESAKIQGVDADAVRTNLETARDRKRQVTFYHDENGYISKDSPKYVKIRPPLRWRQAVQSGANKRRNIKGYIAVRLEEAIG